MTFDVMYWKRNLFDADNVKFLRALSRVIGHINRELYELGYLKDSNAAAHSVDTGIS